MHEPKTKMFELAHGFVALSGGFGNLEKVVEILTWQQLGLHNSIGIRWAF
ncbi:MAG: LOG family protein [Bdellovibrionales bacterium]|nr:LOG family protein [Bdellovibrionales bacterium]